MTTLSQEKEAELIDSIAPNFEEPDEREYSAERAVWADRQRIRRELTSFISTERQAWEAAANLLADRSTEIDWERSARQAAEKEVERLEAELERVRRVDAETLRPLVDRAQAAEAERYKLAAKCEEALSLLADRSTQLDWMTSALSAAEAENDGLSAKLAALVEAARPFAAHYAPWMEDGHKPADQSTVYPRHTLGQLFALRAALSALPPPVPTEEGGELKPCPFCGGDQITTAPSSEFPFLWSAICKACGAARSHETEEDAASAWNTRPTQAPQDVAGLVKGVAKIINPKMALGGVAAWEAHSKANAILALVRPSPISHESKALELAAADNNRELVEALTKSEGAMDIASAFLRGVREHSPSEALDMLQNSITDARARCAVALAAFPSRQEGKAS